MSCELRVHGESYGWEAQFFGWGELLVSRCGFALRELAMRWAVQERRAIETRDSYTGSIRGTSRILGFT
jgi:hypothetical protein